MKKLILMVMLMMPLAIFAQKFGVVDTQTLIQALPDRARAEGELNALQQQKQNEIKSMADELQRQNDEFEKNKSTMNATTQEQKQTEMQNMYQKYLQAQQDAQQEIQKKYDELMAPIRAKIQTAITAVGNAGGYTFIFEKDAALFEGPSVEDVTAKVQAQLNQTK